MIFELSFRVELYLMRLYHCFYVYVIGMQLLALTISLFILLNGSSKQFKSYSKKNIKHKPQEDMNLRKNTRVAVSLMACARPGALNLSLFSIHQAQSRRSETVPIFVTMDCGRREAMIEVVEWWSGVLRGLNYEWYVEANETNEEAFKDERVARHWYWSVQRLFRMGFEYVVHLEDDHVVAGTFFLDLVRLLDWAPIAMCYNMGCGGDCWGSASSEAGHVTWMEAGNMGVVYSRKFWDVMGSDKVKHRFCGMRGNWDINVHVLQSEGVLGVPCATYARSRVGHMVGVSARSSVGGVQEEEPRFDGKFKDDTAVALVDVGGANYRLEENEAGNGLPVRVREKCIRVTNYFNDNNCDSFYGRGAIVIAADAGAQQKYRPAIRSMECYARKHNYSFFLMDPDLAGPECGVHRDIMFKRHCMVLGVLREFDWVAAFDGDVGVVNAEKCLESLMRDGVDVVHEERFHNGEVHAGSYIVRNSEFGREYLTKWMEYERNMPGGFSNSDNGALHLHLLGYIAGNDTGIVSECDRLWRSSMDLNSYDRYVGCVMQYVAKAKERGYWPDKIRLIRRGHGFVRDLWVTEGDQVSPVDFFVHAVKEHIKFYEGNEDNCGGAGYKPVIKEGKMIDEAEMVAVMAKADRKARKDRPLSISDSAAIGHCWPNCEEYWL